MWSAATLFECYLEMIRNIGNRSVTLITLSVIFQTHILRLIHLSVMVSEWDARRAAGIPGTGLDVLDGVRGVRLASVPFFLVSQLQVQVE